IQNFPGKSSPGCYTVIDNGARDLSSGHGTHVAVTAVGDSAPNGMARGVAPSARLLFQAIEDYVDFTGDCELVYTDGYYLFGIPDTLANLFQAAYDGGARLHSNSWGADVSGAYTANSAAADDFVWRHPEMTLIFSAGNRGVDKNSDGFVDSNSIEAPATAKNVIAVGASENDRAGDYPCDTTLTYPSNDPFQAGQTCAAMGGQNALGTYGARWPDAFPVEPIFGDVTAGNSGQMAAFSGRGPTDDGRIKPDVVAPGTWLLSGYSELYRQGYDPEPNNVDGKFQLDGWGFPAGDRYKYFGGTSMAAPLVAGAATVVRDRYQRDFDHAASAALVKATLINTAVDLPDENNDGVNDNDFPIPNIHEGWGRVDLVAATQVAAFVDDPLGVLTDGVQSYTYQLGAAGPFKVTLAWSDFPATEAAAVGLVNDLDLEVTSPAGVTYVGNVFANGWSQTGGEADRVNNVENVFVPSAAAGEWTVTVRGVNVPAGNQPYALVVDGAVEEPVEEPVDEPPAVAITTPADDDEVAGTVSIGAEATDDNGVARVEFYVDGGLLGVDSSSPYTVNWNSTSAVNGRHKLRVRAIDTADQTAEAEVTVWLANPLPDAPPTVSITAPAANAVVEDIVTIAVNAEDDNGIHTVEVLIDGQPFTRDDTPPYIVHWDSRDAANGLHEIRAKAVDTVGQWRDAGVIVEVDNPAVNPNLPLSIVEPADNATISGTVTISAQVAAPNDVTNVEFYVDGRSIGAATAQPFAVEWDSRGVANGMRLLTVLSFSAASGFNNDSVEVTVDNPPPAPSLLLSTAQGGDVGFRFSDEDILRFDPNTGAWSLFFDGSDVGLGASFRHDVDAFDVTQDGAILLSIAGSATMPDVGWVDDSDIVRFVPERLGQNTAGRFELYFEGSDVGLAHDAEDIDALQLLPDGDLLISTIGTVFAPGVMGKDEDLLRFTPATLGVDTSGRWTVYADGSDIGLGDERAEDTSALAVSEDGS
ncbi:MAG: S8 family serine peptidase, partial [Caldilineaceae bacterium]|nr:S8 family serine peptidase [Caldilineaceae bacterium]